MSTSSIMFDVEGLSLSNDERELLAHPGCCGVILFARNYESVDQIQQLVKEIRSAASRNLIITIDQEGGRVQRIQSPLTRLPPLQIFGSMYLDAPAKACALARKAARLMALEIQSLGIDLSFAPVLDLDDHQSKVIGDRAFTANVDNAIVLAREYISGMHDAGMAATGKHFPGHGSVVGDSHEELPIDGRDKNAIWLHDLQPFMALASDLDAVMPAHLIYSMCDERPAGFSSYWLRDVLRGELAFSGAIFSDDLNMAGAAFAGGYVDRAVAALEAGCDIALVCNNRSATEEILESYYKLPQSEWKLESLSGKQRSNWSALSENDAYRQLQTEIESLADHEY